MNINKVQASGNLTKQPEMRNTNTGTAVMSFSLAVNRVWKDKQGDKQEEVEFINCVAWGRTAEIITQYAVKGQNLFIEGRLKTSNYQDKNGVTKYKTEVIVSEMQFGQKPKEAEASPQGGTAAPATGQPASTTGGNSQEDIPVIEEGDPGPIAEGLDVTKEDIPF